MSSQITPNSVNETFPVAGRDNNSQGFRDNFTAIKNNFIYTKREIDDLMNKVVVKSQLTYGPSIDNNLNGQILTGVKLRKESYSVADHSEETSVTVDYAVASQNLIKVAVDDPTVDTVDINFTGFPSTNHYAEVRLIVEVGAVPSTLNFPSPSVVHADGVAGWNSDDQSITFTAANNDGMPYYVFVLSTTDGGTEFRMREETPRGLNHGTEDLAASAAASLTLTGSYFTTAAAETATLADGVEGQFKTFAMMGDSGDMVITVTNAGWGGAGTITFSSVGQGCTLQYMGGKWFCIGNNGAVFA